MLSGMGQGTQREEAELRFLTELNCWKAPKGPKYQGPMQGYPEPEDEARRVSDGFS